MRGLVRNQVLLWGEGKGVAGEPIHKILPVGNVGGFRVSGQAKDPKLVVLYSNLRHPDWPDEIDEVAGKVTYYGDNRTPGSGLESTPRLGNVTLERIFELSLRDRQKVPPIFFFTDAPNGKDKIFKGLIVPGHVNVSPEDWLVAVWRYPDGEKFQNYRATFSLVKESDASEEWLFALNQGVCDQSLEPAELREWRKSKL